MSNVSITTWAVLKKSPNCAYHILQFIGLSKENPYSYDITAFSERGELKI